MHRQRLSGGSNSPPRMYSQAQNRTSRPYTNLVAGYQNQASGSTLQRSYGLTPSPQRQPGQQVPGTQSQGTGHLPATSGLTYAEVVRNHTPVASQYSSARLSRTGSTLAENLQPCSPPRRGPGTAPRRDYTKDMTDDIMLDPDSLSDEGLLLMYTNEGDSEGAREPSPFNSMVPGMSVLPTLQGPVLEKLTKDDGPWSTFHLQAMPQTGPGAFQVNHMGEATHLAAPGMYNPSDSQRSGQYIDYRIAHDQPIEPRSGYGQARGRPTQIMDHRRIPRQVHPNHHVSGGTNLRQTNINPPAWSGDGRSHPSASTTSIPPEHRHCPHCGVQFKGNKDGKGNLARHIRHKHTDCPQICCDYCGQLFKRTDARLKHHRKKHPGFPTPSLSSQRSRQSSMQFQAGTPYDLYSNGSQGLNSFEASQDNTANMGQPYQHPNDLLGLADQY
ncbi:hypothetical protein COCCADRAFT_5474 [Bipolaris zeicola 26-R-13]|uniref:C2H2-type domain-containing protein n=1 Tax=Cochliobolus carbonum (strain 26-R-13) TaxID=930089 RepID=W6Y5L1_COCC2|nr:uncharacterized protein COCCADRAFT_5474 [Bipolaris zeicola 26-R-13]EUC32945.1 hypothetical protein COCCADRAFT_5474 [Bipolaris zeicola 26-R-13]